MDREFKVHRVTCLTFEVKIFCGLLPGYDGDASVHDYAAVKICREYCDKVGLGVTVSQVQFAYTGGDEAGVMVGLINYPRFPETGGKIMAHASNIALMLMEEFKQERVTIVAPDQTIMIERDDAAEGPSNEKEA
jgi:hypothetical protein